MRIIKLAQVTKEIPLQTMKLRTLLKVKVVHARVQDKVQSAFGMNQIRNHRSVTG
jgi:hypothetical protein